MRYLVPRAGAGSSPPLLASSQGQIKSSSEVGHQSALQDVQPNHTAETPWFGGGKLAARDLITKVSGRAESAGCVN